MKTNTMQYAVLHYRHDLITNEVLNIGFVAYAAEAHQFRCSLLKRFTRISNAFPGVDTRFLQKYVNQLQKKFDLIEIDMRERYPEVIAKYSTSLKEVLSSVLPYDDSSIFFSQIFISSFDDFEKTFNNYKSRFVTFYVKEKSKERRNDHEIWESFKGPLSEKGALKNLQAYTIDVTFDEFQFEYGWKNGKVNILQPVSLDISNPTVLKRKGREWVGNITLLDKANQLSNLYLLVGNPQKADSELQKAYMDTLGMLQNRPQNFEVTIVEENDRYDFASRVALIIERDISHHNE